MIQFRCCKIYEGAYQYDEISRITALINSYLILLSITEEMIGYARFRDRSCFNYRFCYFSLSLGRRSSAVVVGMMRTV